MSRSTIHETDNPIGLAVDRKITENSGGKPIFCYNLNYSCFQMSIERTSKKHALSEGDDYIEFIDIIDIKRLIPKSVIVFYNMPRLYN